MPLPLLSTSLVGSYAQPESLIDRKKLAGRFPPRVRAKELWRVAPELLDEAQDDATRIAILDQERAGLDSVTDGELIKKERYDRIFRNRVSKGRKTVHLAPSSHIGLNDIEKVRMAEFQRELWSSNRITSCGVDDGHRRP